MPTDPSSSPPARSEFREGRGWLLLVFAIVTAAFTGPGQTIGVSVFIDHFIEDLDLSRSQVSTAYLIGTLTGAAMLPSMGRFVDRRGVRLAQLIVGALFGLALLNMSAVQGFVWLAIGFTGIRFLGQGSLSLISTVTVSLRFVRNRGAAIGIFSTISGALMVLTPVLLNQLIDAYSWRTTWVIASVIVVTVVVPIAFFGLRDMPRGTAGVGEADRHVSGSPAVDTSTAATAIDPNAYDRSQAIRTRGFWVLAVVTGSAGMLSTALNFHQIDLLGEAGLSESAAAAMFIPQVVGASLAGVTVGFIADRVGTRYLPAASASLLLLAHLLAAVVAPGVVVVLYAVVLGAQGAAGRTTAATLMPNWFGTMHLGSIQGALTFFGVAASAVGPVALAVTENAYGSYAPAVLTLATIPAVALLFSLPAHAPPASPHLA